MSPLTIEFCGEVHVLHPGRDFYIGRESDLNIDDNPFLHRRFLRVFVGHDLWWLENTGTLLSVTVADAAGLVQAWLAPGAKIPIVFAEMLVMFSAGPTTYDFTVKQAERYYSSTVGASMTAGTTTIEPVVLTPSQRLLVVALCESALRRDSPGRGRIAPAKEVAARLGWPLTTYNRKLDNVCEKLDRLGVPGLRGDRGSLATRRRDRLIEYAIASHTVSEADLVLLNDPGSILVNQGIGE